MKKNKINIDKYNNDIKVVNMMMYRSKTSINQADSERAKLPQNFYASSPFGVCFLYGVHNVKK